jgi:hypothetical protein
MASKISKTDFVIASVAGIVGTVLMYVLLSSVKPTAKLSLGVLVLAHVCFATWLVARNRQRRRYGKSVLRETVLVEAGASSVINFSPVKPIENPVLFLRAFGKDKPPLVVVEDIWRNGQNVVFGPHPIDFWEKGVAYPGFLNVIQDAAGDMVPSPPLKIVVRNQGPNMVVVYAHITTAPHTTNKD